MQKIYTAADYSRNDDAYTKLFLKQNHTQFWLPDEISLSPDVLVSKSLKPEEKDTYFKALGGLTLLDTEQGNTGMPLIADKVDGHQRKALLTFMAGMENSVHAQSYSNIFITLASQEEIDSIFSWVDSNPRLQYKAHRIVTYYEKLRDNSSSFQLKDVEDILRIFRKVSGKDIEVTPQIVAKVFDSFISSRKGVDEIDLYKALVASVYLESFLFYSGFYYPLYMYGQGKMMQCGEIINLIIRDESIHGVYVGMIAKEIFDRQSKEKQAELQAWAIDLLKDLMENEREYTIELYSQVGLAEDVIGFTKYNANKALQNLGFDPIYSEEETKFSTIVLNGLNTKTKSHDFFSMKGNGYKKATVEPVKDEDFVIKEKFLKYQPRKRNAC